jgi:hypothetical protein
MADDLELRIARLELEAGDVLVVKTDRKPNHDAIGYLVPAGVRVLYITSDVELSVLTKADIESRTAPVLVPEDWDMRPGAINRVDR